MPWTEVSYGPNVPLRPRKLALPDNIGLPVFAQPPPEPIGILWPTVAVILLSFLIGAVSAAPIGALPQGTWTSTPDLYLQLASGTAVYASQFTLTSSDGTNYSLLAQLALSTSPSAARFNATVLGTAVCSTNDDSLIISISGCTQIGSSFPAFCNYAAKFFAGEFHYGVSSSPAQGLVIDQWSGSLYPVQFLCAGVCTTSVSCNITTINQLFVTLNGGSLTATNSFVTLASNNTAVFNGDQITLTDNNNVTLVQSSSVNQTTVQVSGGTNNTFVFEAPASTFYQVVTTAASGCRNYGSVEAVNANNVTLLSTGFTRVPFTSSSIDAPSADWSLSPDASTLQFNGDNSGDYAYEIRLCMQSGLLFLPSPLGQRVLVALYNVTTGTPVLLGQPGASTVIYNHTNPAFLNGVCTETVVQQVFTGNRFGAYASIQHTDSSSAGGILAMSTYTMLALPLACKGTEININITANFNGSQLEAGTCMSQTTPAPDVIRLNNIGVCGIVATDAPEPMAQQDEHANEGYFTHAWHTFKKYALGSTSTLAGTITFVDVTKGATSMASTQVRHTTSNNLEVRIPTICPINCGEEPIETDGECTCGEGVSSGGPIVTTDTCSCGEVASEGPISTTDTCSCDSGITSSAGTCNCANGVETAGECTCTGGMSTEGQVSASECTCTTIETTIIGSPNGLPVNFPDGASFMPRTPTTVSFDPNQPALSSSTTFPSLSSSTGPGTSGEPSGSGLPGGGGCSPGSLLLKEGQRLVGYDEKGNKLYLIGSVLHSAASSVSSAASSATSAATAVTSAAVSVLEGILCHGGGVPVPQTLGGLPGVPSSGNLPNLNNPSLITGAVAAAAFSSSSTPTTAVPDPTTFSAALAAATSAITTSQLPPNGPTSIVINTGGLQVPIFNTSQPMPTCGGVDRGDIGLVPGNATTDDRVVICANKPTLDGFAYYEIPTTNAVVSAIFRGNGTGILCLPEDNWCQISAYPNNTLFALRPTQKITPGSCTFCTLTWDSAGDIVEATSGNITLYNTSSSLVNVTQYYSNSMIAMDNESSIVNAGYSVMNQVLITDLNVTDSTTFFGPVTFLGGSGGTPPPMTLGSGANCSSTATLSTYQGNSQWITLSIVTGSGTCPGNTAIATLAFGTQTGITSSHMCAVNGQNTFAAAAGTTAQGTSTVFAIGSPAGGLTAGTSYVWQIGPCGGW